MKNEMLTLCPVTLKDSTLPWERQVGFVPVNKSDAAFLVEEYGDNWGEVWEEHSELGNLRYIDNMEMLNLVELGVEVKIIK
jgi:hypothetical protein